MFAYSIRRLLQVIPTLLGVAVLVFLLMRLIPGDPTTMAGQTVSEDVRLALRKQWHLDDSMPVQFWHYAKGIPVLDFGVSMRFGTPVRGMIGDYFLNTLLLAVVALFISVTFGISCGILAALMKDTWVDRSVMAVSLLGISTPVFVVGIVLMIVAVKVGYVWFGGTGDRFDLRYAVLPAVTLGSRSVAYLARMTRSSVVEFSEADFVRTARAKGLGRRSVIFKHLMKNAMIPIITVVGLSFGDYLTGAILTESIFQWPGIGMLIRNAIAFRDLPVIMGTVLFTTTIFVLVNFAVDLLYAVFDPRIRLA